MGYFRHYIDVITYNCSNGTLTPMAIVWDDGAEYEIDRVLEARPAAAMKAGGAGIRFTVRIRNQLRYLWLEEGRWFVEDKSE